MRISDQMDATASQPEPELKAGFLGYQPSSPMILPALQRYQIKGWQRGVE